MTHRVTSWLVLTAVAVGLVLLLAACDLFTGGGSGAGGTVTVDFEATPRSGEPPLAVTFTAIAQGDVASFLWDFGDGATSTEQNPDHTYADEGIYSVTLTVEPSAGDPVSESKPDHITVLRRDAVTAPIFITFVNDSDDPNLPEILVFARNEASASDELTDEVAWRVMSDLAKGASSTFLYLHAGTVQAMWGDCNKTSALPTSVGSRYTVEEDATGIVIVPSGSATQPNAIEVSSVVHVDGGILAQLFRDDKLFMQEQIVAYGQKATFIVEPTLYWGVAAEIQEGQLVASAVLETDTFFEQNLEGVSQATVTLSGDSLTGYQFTVESN